MKVRTHFLLAATLVVGVCFSAFAQKGGTIRLPPPEPIGTIVSVDAIEVTDGTLGFDTSKNETMYGYSFLGQTRGALPGSFTLAMNCTPAAPIPGGTSEIVSGSWTLPVYMGDTGYAGSVYGTVAKGTLTWDETGTSASVYMQFNVDGGTQTWDGYHGFATFVGTLSVDEKTQKTIFTGDMMFDMAP